MIHPFESDRELSTGECWDGFCDICGYKNCRCDELEATAHRQHVRDTRKAIDNLVSAARTWLRNRFWRAA